MGSDTLRRQLMDGGRNDPVDNVQVTDGAQPDGLVVGQGGRPRIHAQRLIHLVDRLHMGMPINHHLWSITLEVFIDIGRDMLLRLSRRRWKSMDHTYFDSTQIQHPGLS